MLMDNGDIDVESVNCCYAVHKFPKKCSDNDLYTFDDPFNMTSIRLIRSKSYLLKNYEQ